MLTYNRTGLLPLVLVTPFIPSAASAQVRLDRADPTITERTLPRLDPEESKVPSEALLDPSNVAAGVSTQRSRSVSAITVQGAEGVAADAYATIIAPLIGRALTRAELADLASAIASIVRSRGFPFATATIEPQAMADGILRVSVDQGRIDAVRVIGGRNSVADAVLVRTLVTHGPVRQADLEHALLLAGDIPGLRVKESRYLRQDGFGILLVTVEEDPASAYVQLDNRGSEEVGPLRSTLLGSLRGVAGDGDELGLILAQTPGNIDEFNFFRARYSAPVDSSGSVLAVSGSYGRSNPGASLKPLNVVGISSDVSVSYARPLLRRKARSMWWSIEFRAIRTEQTLAGRQLRDDRLTTLATSLNGFAEVAGGTLRGEASAQAGLPLAGVTKAGDVRTSRSDGDARFAAASFLLDWTAKVAGPFSMVVSSASQIASRPLLATAEIAVGGPGFGRAYDYAERTGDTGIMGSIEVQANGSRILPGVIDRAQLYSFVDGGTVGNLRDGTGGGTLASTGAGLRAGTGLMDGMIELAFPLTPDRFDTGDKRPRISLRLSRLF